MSFKVLRENILKLLHQRKIKIDIFNLKSGSVVGMEFPGYKTCYPQGKYDYAVFVRKNNKEWKVSHKEIVRDLYRKALLLKNSGKIDLLYDFIFNLSTLADKLNLSSYTEIDTLCNSQNGFQIEELKYIISLVALQEDINYPQQQGKLGRKMCFYKYCEAICCAKEGKNIQLVLDSLNSPRQIFPGKSFYSTVNKLAKDE